MFFDEKTSTLTYIVFDEQTKDALVIDPVWNYERNSTKLSTESVDRNIDFIKEEGLNLLYIMETHAHADHLSGSQLLKKAFPKAQVAIGSHITSVQELFKKVYNMEYLKTDGSQFDKLISNGENFSAGSLNIEAFNTPGHTPACMSYLINGKTLFSGDSLFMPDSGCGRCDFPKGNAEDLFNSIKNTLYSLPDSTEVYVGHDYQPKGRPLEYKSTIGESKKFNISIKDETEKDEFITFRKEKDRTLETPKLLYHGLQVNINAGRLPRPDSNGKSYLKLPLN